jgi:hypothetical protein
MYFFRQSLRVSLWRRRKRVRENIKRRFDFKVKLITIEAFNRTDGIFGISSEAVCAHLCTAHDEDVREVIKLSMPIMLLLRAHREFFIVNK